MVRFRPRQLRNKPSQQQRTQPDRDHRRRDQPAFEAARRAYFLLWGWVRLIRNGNSTKVRLIQRGNLSDPPPSNMNSTFSFLSTPPMQIMQCHYVATRVGIAFICTYIYSFFRRKSSYFCACWLSEDSLSSANPDDETAVQLRPLSGELSLELAYLQPPVPLLRYCLVLPDQLGLQARRVCFVNSIRIHKGLDSMSSLASYP